MANWKKVIVSGSSPEFSTLHVDNLASGVVTGSGTTLGTQAINGTGNILATTGATGISASGSFSGSFEGNFIGTTNLPDLTEGAGIAAFTYDGSSTATVAVSGAASLIPNNITKWDGNSFQNASLYDNGTVVTGSVSIQLTGASSNLSGSFSGSFSGLADRAVSSSYANNATTASYALLSANTELFDNRNSATFASTGSNIFYGTQTINGEVNITSNLNVSSSNANTTTTLQTLVVQNGASGSFSGSFQGDGSGLTGIAATLLISGSTGNGSVDIKTQTLSVVGTANEIETSASGQTITIGLPDDVTVNGDLVVQQNLTVFGTASFQQTTNLEVADRFVLFASGSNAPGDGGIVIQQGTQNVGELFGYDATTVRWGVTSSFSADAGTFTPDAFMAVASIGLSADPTAIDARYQAKGNLFIGTDEGIWIYS